MAIAAATTAKSPHPAKSAVALYRRISFLLFLFFQSFAKAANLCFQLPYRVYRQTSFLVDLLVRTPRPAVEQQCPGFASFPSRARRGRATIRGLRLHQWVKNLMVLFALKDRTSLTLGTLAAVIVAAAVGFVPRASLPIPCPMIGFEQYP